MNTLVLYRNKNQRAYVIGVQVIKFRTFVIIPGPSYKTRLLWGLVKFACPLTLNNEEFLYFMHFEGYFS